MSKNNVKNNAKMPDLNLIIQAGIDPKSGLPIKLVQSNGSYLKAGIRKLLNIIDKQDAINRFRWYNLPSGLNGHLIERILYYKGQGMFFYQAQTNQFYFLPYALDGAIDVYGRFMAVKPLPFQGTATYQTVKEYLEDDIGKNNAWLNITRRYPMYEVLEPGELDKKIFEEGCVILRDISLEISQTNIPRESLNSPLLDVESDIIPFLRTALMKGTGISGTKVSADDEQASVDAMNGALYNAALTGRTFVGVKTTSALDMQELTGGSISKAEEYLLSLQSLENLRLGMYGLQNGGIFQKKAHILESEQAINQGETGLILQDSLTIRQEFCNIVNSIWGLGIWCEPSENATEHDRDMDGEISETFENEAETVSNEPIGGEEDV